jgi:3-oxoacyl-[acyl-carrier-protein] synthase II
MSERVVISGVGMVTPLGMGKKAFSRRLFRGDSGISPITFFDTSRFFSKLGAEVHGFIPKDFISVKNLRRMDRISCMTAASARMATEDASFGIDSSNRDRVGIILGVSYGSTDVAAQFASILFTEGPRPILVPNMVINAPAGHTSIELGFRGINSTVNHREASAETAIAYAAAEIKNGRADVLLAGGADILSEFFFAIMTHFKAVSPVDDGAEGARPFDKQRNGPVIGEGAGVLCIESMDHAVTRGATPYCEIAGWGLSSSPSSPTDWPSDPGGPILAITRALESAKITPGDIDYISASANGGRKLDRLEVEALSEVFAGEKRKPFISSIKGAVGESFSSGGIRTAAMAISIREQTLPPTLGLENPIKSGFRGRQPIDILAGSGVSLCPLPPEPCIPIQPLRFILNIKKEARINYGLVNGFSSGGTFISIVLKRIDI